MKHFHRVAFLAVFLLTLAACQGWPASVDVGQLGTVVRDAVQAVDKSGDGIVSNAELRAAKNDPMIYIGGLLGLLGLIGGETARRRANKVEAEVDQQWDAKLASAEAKIAALKAASAPKA